MKLNWGSGLVIAFVAFGVGIMSLVLIAMRQSVDLVAEDYYERELRHQDQIERTKRSAAIKDSVQIAFEETRISVRFPASVGSGTITGSAQFYRPSDQKLDTTNPLDLDSANSRTFDLSRFEKGLWRMKLLWTQHGKEYYREEVFFLQ